MVVIWCCTIFLNCMRYRAFTSFNYNLPQHFLLVDAWHNDWHRHTLMTVNTIWQYVTWVYIRECLCFTVNEWFYNVAPQYMTFELFKSLLLVNAEKNKVTKNKQIYRENCYSGHFYNEISKKTAFFPQAI